MNTGSPNNSESLPARSVLQTLVAARTMASAFQPIVSCETGEIAGLEALARPSPGSGIANPGVLFAMADAYKMMWEVEEVTRESAFRWAEDFPNGILLFCNSTPETFCDKRFVDSITDAVRAVPGLTPSRVVLEITEHGNADDLSRITEQVTQLKALGFQIAIDDVGAGTSGLNRIMMLRPHWLKLDRELVSNIDTNRFKLNLIRFMVHFARLSGVSVIAEGIERREELDTLIELGVKYIQGFYVGRPALSYKTIDPSIAEMMRTRWAECQSARLADPRRVPLSKLSEPAETAQAAMPVFELAQMLIKRPAVSGVAVLDGSRLVGWASRDTVINGARHSDRALPVGYLSSNDLGTLSPTATVNEALEMIAQRDDSLLGAPIIISANERVSGIVTLKRLLGATVGESRLSGSAVAGLPRRVDGEKRLRTLLSARVGTCDVAFIDVRGFSDFNGACGYETGDKLISDLTALLRLHLSGSDDGLWFLSHMGDDRFMAIGPSELIGGALTRVVEQFERDVPSVPTILGQVTEGGADGEAPVMLRLGLRVILLPGVFARVRTVRQIVNLEQETRRALRTRGETPSGRSLFVKDTEVLVEGERRKSA